MHQYGIPALLWSYSAPPDPLAKFKGPISEGRAGQGRRGGKEKGEEGKGLSLIHI